MSNLGTWLFAERSMLRDMGSGFREKREHFDATDLLLWMLLIVGVFVAISFVALIVSNQDKRRLFNSPRRLFRALCHSHELNRSSRRLLTMLARAHGIDQPAQLFLNPGVFEAEQQAPRLPAHRLAIDSLARKLFAAESSPAG